jgi:hypothetical protein
MKRTYFVSLFTILVIVLGAAQFNPVAQANQPSAPAAQESPSGAPVQLAAVVAGAQMIGTGEASPRLRSGDSERFPASRFQSDILFAAPATSIPLIFLPPATYNSGGFGPVSVAVADLNGDGKPDLVVADECASTNPDCSLGGIGSVGVLLGNGDGTFQAPVSYSSGGYSASAVAVADVNGDGKPDIVVANWCTSNINCEIGGERPDWGAVG